MLPYTPLHHRLFDGEMPPLVMTSGNLTDEPLAKDNEEAVRRLSPLCDAFLLHDRRIERRIDDAVVQIGQAPAAVVRRSRGYVPRPVGLKRPVARPMLAVGAELKNTICVARGSEAVLSEHIGDLTDVTVYRHFEHAVRHLENLVQVQPDLIAHDLHPLYLSTQYARRQAELRTIAVQHHWAHAVSCMAENGLDEPVLAVVCDGTGYGTDGAVWGCEILRAEPGRFERLGHLRYFPLPGGDAAARELDRAVMGLLYQSYGVDCAGLEAAKMVCSDVARRRGLLEMLASGTHCPATSSLGRVFDAVACLLGLASHNDFEGQAPMALEAAAASGVSDSYPYGIERGQNGLLLDIRPIMEAILSDVRAGRGPAVVSAKFHNGMVDLLAAAAVAARDTVGLNKVVLSGGCFVNRRLRGGLLGRLEQAGMQVWTHRQVPCNDGGIALGQVVVAASCLEDSASPGPTAAGEVSDVPGATRAS
jgi:hydrogenase maturation protein HypF